MDKSRQKDIFIVVLFVILIGSAYGNVKLLSDNLDLTRAFDTLASSVIGVSSCPLLKQMEQKSAIMDRYGDLIQQTEKDKNCPP